MKLLFDQNISFRILNKLPEFFLDSSHVSKENLINSSDLEIWEFAKRKGFTIITKDSDFNDLTNFYGMPPKVIWLRTGNIGTDEILSILINHKIEIEDFINSMESSTLQLFKIHN